MSSIDDYEHGLLENYKLHFGIDRGDLMITFLQKVIPDMKTKKVLDIGCGKGGISISFSNNFKQVISVDQDIKNVLITRKRRDFRKINTIDCMACDAEYLPFDDETFDVVLLNGVLEWVGYGKANAQESQHKTLLEVKRVLKNNGTIYVAIENRMFPYFLMYDPHINMPFVNAMPRKIANIYMGIFRNEKYGNYIYSYWGLKSLLSKVFGTVNFYAPIPHYQFPYRVVPFDDRTEIGRSCRELSGMNFDYNSTNFSRTLSFIGVINRLRLNKLFSPYFICVCQKESL